MANQYDNGDLVRVSVVFTDSSNANVDPTVVKVSVKTPAGVTTTYTYGTDAALVKDSAGHYHLDIDASASGTWHYRWFSTGTGQAAAESFFVVNAGNF